MSLKSKGALLPAVESKFEVVECEFEGVCEAEEGGCEGVRYAWGFDGGFVFCIFVCYGVKLGYMVTSILRISWYRVDSPPCLVLVYLVLSEACISRRISKPPSSVLHLIQCRRLSFL